MPCGSSTVPRKQEGKTGHWEEAAFHRSHWELEIPSIPAASGALWHVLNGSGWPSVAVVGCRLCFSDSYFPELVSLKLPSPRSFSQGITAARSSSLPEPWGQEGPDKGR